MKRAQKDNHIRAPHVSAWGCLSVCFHLNKRVCVCHRFDPGWLLLADWIRRGCGWNNKKRREMGVRERDKKNLHTAAYPAVFDGPSIMTGIVPSPFFFIYRLNGAFFFAAACRGGASEAMRQIARWIGPRWSWRTRKCGWRMQERLMVHHLLRSCSSLNDKNKFY